MAARGVKSERAIIRFGIAAGRASGQVSLCRMRGIHPECALELTGLYVDPSARGRGWSHMLLDQACKYADDRHIDLFLRILPFGTRVKQRANEVVLTNLYNGHGFKNAQADGWDMVREVAA